ncbi:MAG: hypothetical protein IPK68_16520 [Bdellovibrionales bacterium]|nr:hypothetical protein [Bdellovibrionales bacterium]
MQDKSNTKNAVLVGIQLPNVSVQDLDGSMRELKGLVTTLGYQVIGQVTQKRKSDRSASILGKGKLKELALWTGGSGEVSMMVDRKLNKAAVKWQEEGEDENRADEDRAEKTRTDSTMTHNHGNGVVHLLRKCRRRNSLRFLRKKWELHKLWLLTPIFRPLNCET